MTGHSNVGLWAAAWHIGGTCSLLWCQPRSESCFFFPLIGYPWGCVVVQSLSCAWLSVTLWTAACQAPLSFTVFRSLLKSMATELVVLSNQRILCCPLLLLSSVFPSIRVLSSKSTLGVRWPKYWTFRSVLLKNIQCWLPLGLTSLISLQSEAVWSEDQILMREATGFWGSDSLCFHYKNISELLLPAR